MPSNTLAYLLLLANRRRPSTSSRVRFCFARTQGTVVALTLLYRLIPKIKISRIYLCILMPKSIVNHILATGTYPHILHCKLMCDFEAQVTEGVRAHTTRVAIARFQVSNGARRRTLICQATGGEAPRHQRDTVFALYAYPEYVVRTSCMLPTSCGASERYRCTGSG